MRRQARLTTTLAALVLATSALAGCADSTEAQAVPPSPTPSATPAPAYVTELPEWALASSPWLIYPDGFECYGTEGCPNDFRALIGEPGPVLPDGVEYYDPAKHDCVVVRPLGVSCAG
jgi:hypothetical protein